MWDTSNCLPAGFGLLSDSGMLGSEANPFGRSALRLGDTGLWQQIPRSFELGMPSLNLPPPPFVLIPEISFPFTTGNSQLTLPKAFPMGCLLKNLKALGLINLKPKHLIFYCNTAWPQYKLGDQEVLP